MVLCTHNGLLVCNKREQTSVTGINMNNNHVKTENPNERGVYYIVPFKLLEIQICAF